MGFRVAAAVLLLLTAAACGGVTSPSDNVVETFSGTIEPKPSPNYIAIHHFTTQNTGEIEVTITALAPLTNVFVATFFGRTQSDGCGFDPFNPPNEFSTLNRPSIVAPITKGNWCVGIYDPGTLTRAVTYTLTVSHP